jgi:hypothetical protein
MSIGNYTELKTAVQDFAHRSDLSTVVASLIMRGEAALNRKLRLLPQEQRTPLTATQGSKFVELPAGFLETVALHVNDNGSLTRLNPATNDVIDMDSIESATGIPSYYRIGSQIEFDVAADQAYPLQLHWYKRWDIEADTTNWLLIHHPDLYMDAALAEVGLYTRDAEMAAMYRAMTAEKINEVMQDDAKKRRIALRTVDPALLAQSANFNVNRGY